MAPDVSPPVSSLLQSLRKARRISVAQLARAAGVSRQTIYAIEDGGFIPNTAVALRLARFLDVRVEDIFALGEENGAEFVEAELLAEDSGRVEQGQLVRLCETNGRFVALPVPELPAFLPPAEGTVLSRAGSRVSVRAAGPASGKKQFLLAGCDPAISLLDGALATSGIELIGVPSSSRRALEYLGQGRVHAAGSHLRDLSTGDYNVPLVKRLFQSGTMCVVTFAVWEQGLVLRRGNPKNIRSIPDLADKQAVLMNREEGSGSRNLLDNGLREANIQTAEVAGYENHANGHLPAAYAVASGAADCCIANRSAAQRFQLDFVPLAVERFDLVFSRDALQSREMKPVLDVLNSAVWKRKLRAIAGYDTAQTGNLLM